MDELNREETNIGIVKISDDVVSVIASIAAAEIKGVSEIHQGVTSGITQMITGKKNVSKGIKVSIEEGEATIDVVISVEYGIKIPDVVTEVQINVKKTVEAMTGLNVSAVNVYVQNIILPKVDEKQK
ncbi:Uncharacterized conserved protein YloU, alkaline shock protein (Asp23) family [Clostridium cavendishii DSM 21758]|uniref:Uncharacterized conserved protein YloU, alkaline shock protein (Asp23) family n=1 Tax=Clostridium cavendishii DSM 21758 TaxID=1121302 RepID=A0A1M6KKF7_9CLOT|nr:Asp23/Gls24 family envelope stress response protein [Clostridium cavendishii]SHJ59409.1 Uncharacterized conserved protein YloU, alkaline shock protein (Asp23) family [Clostridium cavendishii DSM 21758]